MLQHFLWGFNVLRQPVSYFKNFSCFSNKYHFDSWNLLSWLYRMFQACLVPFCPLRNQPLLETCNLGSKVHCWCAELLNKVHLTDNEMVMLSLTFPDYCEGIIFSVYLLMTEFLISQLLLHIFVFCVRVCEWWVRWSGNLSSLIRDWTLGSESNQPLTPGSLFLVETLGHAFFFFFCLYKCAVPDIFVLQKYCHFSDWFLK